MALTPGSPKPQHINQVCFWSVSANVLSRCPTGSKGLSYHTKICYRLPDDLATNSRTCQVLFGGRFALLPIGPQAQPVSAGTAPVGLPAGPRPERPQIEMECRGCVCTSRAISSV